MIAGTTPGSPPRNGHPEGGTYTWNGKQPVPGLTTGQADVLRLLATGPHTGAELGRRWPSRGWQGIREAADRLVKLGLACRLADGWAITAVGRAALEAS
ncbi:MAG: MarR family transcriptional regulator [Streptosporangiaceae bacterium]